MKIQVKNALETIDELLPLLEDAESNFDSAHSWGIFDMLGGGALTTFIKHSRIDDANRDMDEINLLLQQLTHQLGDINFPEDLKLELGDFATFADFFFDGFLIDAFVASKITESIEKIRETKEKLEDIKRKLKTM